MWLVTHNSRRVYAKSAACVGCPPYPARAVIVLQHGARRNCMSGTNVDQLTGSSELFSGLSKKQRKAVARLLTPVTVAQGTVLTREGDMGREAMLIASGMARVERDGNHVAMLGPGELFGELALLTGARRMALVTAAN